MQGEKGGRKTRWRGSRKGREKEWKEKKKMDEGDGWVCSAVVQAQCRDRRCGTGECGEADGRKKEKGQEQTLQKEKELE